MIWLLFKISSILLYVIHRIALIFFYFLIILPICCCLTKCVMHVTSCFIIHFDNHSADQIEHLITKTKEEALSRKEIL